MMKKQILFAVAFVLAIGLNGEVFAQEGASLQKRNLSGSKASLSKEAVCKVKVKTTSNNYEILFINEVVAPRDAASGLPTGKRQHKPVRIIKEIDKSTPLLAKVSSGGGAGKVTMQNLTCTIISKGKKIKVPVRNNQFTIPDGVDDDCDMVLSWDWKVSGSNQTERCVCPLKLTLDNGACVAAKETASRIR